MSEQIWVLNPDWEHAQFVSIAELRECENKLEAANERIKKLEETLIGAWEIIANVSGGDWTRQKPHWQDYVFKWRDDYFNPIMKESPELRDKEDKP